MTATLRRMYWIGSHPHLLTNRAIGTENYG